MCPTIEKSKINSFCSVVCHLPMKALGAWVLGCDDGKCNNATTIFHGVHTSNSNRAGYHHWQATGHIDHFSAPEKRPKLHKSVLESELTLWA